MSSISAREISVKRAKGLLRFLDIDDRVLHELRFIELPVSIRHGFAAGELPTHHRGPFDRMLVAQAMSDGMTDGG